MESGSAISAGLQPGRSLNQINADSGTPLRFNRFGWRSNDQIIESIDAPPQGIAMAPAELGEGRFRIGPADDEVNLRMQIGGVQLCLA